MNCPICQTALTDSISGQGIFRCNNSGRWNSSLSSVSGERTFKGADHNYEIRYATIPPAGHIRTGKVEITTDKLYERITGEIARVMIDYREGYTEIQAYIVGTGGMRKPFRIATPLPIDTAYKIATNNEEFEKYAMIR